MGFVTVLSQGSLIKVRIFDKNIFSLLEFVTSNVMLPLGGFFIVLFVGWYFGRKRTSDELSNNGELSAKHLPLYMFLIRFIAPVAIAFVFLNSLEVIQF